VTIHGIDVSAAQGVLTDAHWRAIAKDKSFVYCEARTGNDGNDAQFKTYVAGARAAGIRVGAYLFAYCLVDSPIHPGRSPEEQAQAFFEASGGLGGSAGELSPVIDLEDPTPDKWVADGGSAAQVTDWSGRCATKVSSLFGRSPVIYTYPDWALHAGLAGLEKYLLWLAVYGGSTYRTVKPWTSAAILQVGAGTYTLPNGLPCDEDEISDDTTIAGLLDPTTDPPPAELPTDPELLVDPDGPLSTPTAG
jgi:lysozyme